MNEKKKKRILLHVGFHKTGTSSIQETLSTNRDLLEKNGFLYPECWPSNHSIPLFSAFCDQPNQYRQNIYIKKNQRTIQDANKSNLFNLKTTYQKKRNLELLISGEDISNLSQKNLESLKRYFEFISNEKAQFLILIYVRDPVTLAVSLTQEWIKQGFDFEQAFRNTKTEIYGIYKKKIRRFENVFGKENIYIYQFEKALKHHKGIAGHFLNIIGFTKRQIHNFKILKRNQSISQTSADIISFINKKVPLLLGDHLNQKRKKDDCETLLKLSGPRFNLSNHDKQEIYELEKAEIMWLKTNFQIDYLRTKVINEPVQEYFFTNEICEDIKSAILKTTNTLRELIIDYFRTKVSPNKFYDIQKEAFIKRLEKIQLSKQRFKCKTLSKTHIKDTFNFMKSFWVLKKSDLFDEVYYLKENPEVKNPIFHYLIQGAKENRNPSRDFCTEYYKRMNQDLLSSNINPLVHYILFGKKEGRLNGGVIEKINFLLCGNSYESDFLSSILKTHPEIEMPDLRELHFFDNDEYFKNNKPNYIKYHNNFFRTENTKCLGEATFSYLTNEKAIERIKQYNKKIKWIIILEDSKRTYHLDKKEIKENNSLDLSKLLESFEKNQLCVVYNKVIKENPEELLQKVYDFLEIESWFLR